MAAPRGEGPGVGREVPDTTHATRCILSARARACDVKAAIGAVFPPPSAPHEGSERGRQHFLYFLPLPHGHVPKHPRSGQGGREQLDRPRLAHPLLACVPLLAVRRVQLHDRALDRAVHVVDREHIEDDCLADARCRPVSPRLGRAFRTQTACARPVRRKGTARCTCSALHSRCVRAGKVRTSLHAPHALEWSIGAARRVLRCTRDGGARHDAPDDPNVGACGLSRIHGAGDRSVLRPGA